MISKSTIKLINSLALKKYRTKEKLFLVEGDKLVAEVIQSQLEIKELIVTSGIETLQETNYKNVEKLSSATQTELKKASLLQNPQNSIAICRIPPQYPLPSRLGENLSIFLDGIQDPGNLGTIIRICDWYGIEYIFCSPDTVDFYNPKVIQASMGSFNRVKFWECDYDVAQSIAQKSESTIYGAFMEGKNIYAEKLSKSALLVVGNEGNGIRSEIKTFIDKKISIPNFSTNSNRAESLNVSVATAIICSEFKRTQ